MPIFERDNDTSLGGRVRYLPRISSALSTKAPCAHICALCFHSLVSWPLLISSFAPFSFSFLGISAPPLHAPPLDPMSSLLLLTPPLPPTVADHKTHLERARSERALADSAWVGDDDDEAMDLEDHKGTHNLWEDDPFSVSQGHAEVGGGLMAYECAMEEDPSGPMLEQATYKTREDWQRFLKNSEDAHARQGVAKSIAFDAMQSNLQRGGEVAQEWADLSKKARGAHEAGGYGAESNGCGYGAESNGWGDGGGGMEGMD